MTKLFVGNISSTTSDKDLTDLFGTVAGFVSAKISFGVNNENSRSGYVVMKDDDEAKKAIAKFNNQSLNGNRLRVMKAHPIDQKSDFFANQHRPRNYYKK
jgi:RNA recognition motif-containing protein